jgi:hypothetical protein
MWRFTPLCLVAVLYGGAGCVMVNPGEMHVGSPVPGTVRTPKPTPEPMTAYGPKLQRVIEQQDKVLKELRKGHFSKAADLAGEWMEDVRVLNGYAGASHDPARFQAYCGQLLARTQTVRDAAVRNDSVRCEEAIRSCDPVLNDFTRDFPMSAIAPPAAAPRPPKAASSPPPPRVP